MDGGFVVRRRGHRGVRVPRVRRRHHLHRGNRGPAPEHSPRRHAHRADRRRHLRGRLLRHAAGAPANLAAIDRFAASAAGDGAALVAFTEYATYEKKKVDVSFPAVAEPLDGPVCVELAATAAPTASRWWRAWWKPRTSRAGRTTPWCRTGPTAAGWLPTGRSTCSMRRASVSLSSSSPARTLHQVVFEHGGVRFGLMTCYDLRFPERARSLADAGAQVLLVCSSWVPGENKTEQWLELNGARAIENSVYVAGGVRHRRSRWAGAC
jgi:hypothetical protein